MSKSRMTKSEQPIIAKAHSGLESKASESKFKPENTGVGVPQFEGNNHPGLLAKLESEVQRADLALHLQTTHGNAFVQRLLESQTVQAKLTVSQPDDPYEIEADNMAEAVTRFSADAALRQANPEEEEPPLQTKISRLQRKSSDLQREDTPEDEEEVQAKFSDLQREATPEEEEQIQAKSADIQTEVSDDLETRINASRGTGRPLADSARTNLEPGFGADFSDVKVHTGAEADMLSSRLNAEAFTTGKDIFFKEGRYQPDSEDGRKLIAHELTHVVQQSQK
jgi:hypothetical protein